MRLVRLEVWNWRGLEHEALDFAPDLNLVVGPNESGKSRLFEALRHGLFERYKGESEEKKKLRTWGGSESPAVEVHFEAGGASWKLHKRFLKGAHARLEGGGRTLVDDDAETELRRLWKTREVKGKKDIEQFLGLWPLLWVQQGKAGLAPHLDFNDDARGLLRDALAAQVNEVAAGPRGQRIVERAEAERARYWTSTWRETSELAAARERASLASSAARSAKARRDEAHASADELAHVEAALGESRARVNAQREETERTRARLVASRERAALLGKQELEVATHNAKRELAEQRLLERDALARDVGALAAQIDAAGKALASLEASRVALVTREASARARVEHAEADEQRAREGEARSARRARRSEAERRLEEATRALAGAELHRGRLREIEDELRRVRATGAEMKALRKAKDVFSRASAALHAASLRLTLRAARDLVVDGEPVRAGEERKWSFDEPSTIAIEGVGELHVSPAGAELHRLRDEEHDAKEVLHALLAELGVATVADAEDRHQRRVELESEQKQHDALVRHVAPDGAERLEEAARVLRAELAALAQTTDDEEAAAPSVDEVSSLALATLKEARAARDIIGRNLARTSEDAAVQSHALTELRARQTSLTARLTTPPSREDLAREAAARAEQWASALALSKSLEQDQRRRGDLDAAFDLEREEKALAQLESTHRKHEDLRIELQAAVRHLGAEGIHEELQVADASLDEASRDLERVLRRAEAARALVTALTDARREVQERLVAPVRERVEPYLAGLLPGAALDMDEDFAVRGLRVGNQSEDFDALSGGAKEQVGLLVRLGLAEVLGQGEALPVVLDDCLVNTDPERQKDMLRILYRASRRQQIVLFSCHDVAFDRLGASRRFDLTARRVR